MVDFKSLRPLEQRSAPVDPKQIFEQLPKPEGVNDLWESQAEALKGWFARRGETDLVIKLNTGGGKTLVGLLIAQSSMNERRASSLYLCPTRQLVEQTYAKALEFQLPAVMYERGKPLAAGFLNGE